MKNRGERGTCSFDVPEGHLRHVENELHDEDERYAKTKQSRGNLELHVLL
jgi:hypothetical protein